MKLRTQQLLLESLLRFNSLFPENVHQRIITDKAEEAKMVKKKQNEMGGRLGLRSYLTDGEENNAKLSSNELDLNSKPIADLFPAVTRKFIIFWMEVARHLELVTVRLTANRFTPIILAPFSSIPPCFLFHSSL